MAIKQLSVFLENKEGKLEKVTETLMESGINIISLSLADTSEYGMLRMIVSDPAKGKEKLKEADFSAMLTDVVAVKLPHEPGALHRLLKALLDVNVEYMYAFSSEEKALMVLKLSDAAKAETLLAGGGFEMMGEEVYGRKC